MSETYVKLVIEFVTATVRLRRGFVADKCGAVTPSKKKTS